MQSLIQLRQLLQEKFPGVRMRACNFSGKARNAWKSGIAKLDESLGGGFPKSAINEVIAPRRGCGSALLLLQLLRRAAGTNQLAALIDGTDSFDAASVEQSTLSRLLWIRCHNAAEAVKATDLVLRDGNLPVVLLDLALNPVTELHKIPAPTWYRFQRIVEESTATFIVLTPRPMISPAEGRVTLHSRFGLQHIEADQVKLTMELDFEVADARAVATEERKIA